MRIGEIGIAPRPLQRPHPPLYGGFTNSMRTAVFWAWYAGKPIVLASDLEFCRARWVAYREEAERWGHDIARGKEADGAGTPSWRRATPSRRSGPRT